MSFGHLFKTKVTNNGSGWPLTALPGRLLECLSAIEVVIAHRLYGILCLEFIGNVLFVTQIFGRLTLGSFHLKDTIQSTRTVAKPMELSASIVPFASESLAW